GRHRDRQSRICHCLTVSGREGTVRIREMLPMSERFEAVLINRDESKKQSVDFVDLSEADLMDGDVTVAVEYSTVNYKDGLALTGKSPVVRRFPMVPGIDFAGTVLRSSHPDWKEGDKVILNGWGVGETHFGAYAKRARVSGDWLVALPE